MQTSVLMSRAIHEAISSWLFQDLYIVKKYAGLALADRQFVISERISQMTKGNVTAFVNLTKAIKQLINDNVLECFRN